jgi:hypothetical protein
LRLDELKKAGFLYLRWLKNHKTYDNLQSRLDQEGHAELVQGRKSLSDAEWSALQKNLDVVSLMAVELPRHIETAGARQRELENAISKSFMGLCRRAVACLKTVDCREANTLVKFEALFLDLSQCVLHFPFVLGCEEVKKEFCLATQLVHGILKSGVVCLEGSIAGHEFSKARSLVLYNRTDGAFLADHYSILKEELKQRNTLGGEQWLDAITDLCNRHFSRGRDLANIKSCAIVGVLPSAQEDEIKRAYKQRALEVHPDKKVGDNTTDSGEEFRRLKEAYDILLSPRSREKVTGTQPFDSLILGIPETLKSHIRQCLRDQKYELVELLLQRMPDFNMVCNLVTPNIDGEGVRISLVATVQECVHGLKIAVDTLWNERKYKELNHSINDLKQMESHLKAFPDVFPKSWNRSIVEKVEQ